MPDYRLFHFDGARIKSADVITASDEAGAVRIAMMLAGSRKAELWRGAVMLRTINPLGESS